MRQPPTHPATSRDSLTALWRPSALMGVLLGGEALAAVLALANADSPDRLVSFGLASLVILWITLGTLCALYLLRKPLAALPPLRLAWVALALLLGMTLLVATAAWSILHITNDAAEARTAFVLRALALAFVVGLMTLVVYRNYAETKRLAVRAKQLELEALQARIRPHFLFNTLNTGAALVHAQPDVAERVLLDLADLFRSALRGPQLIPLTEELTLTRRYLEIEALRFGSRLELHWDVADPLPHATVPSLSIQPLAENAIRHGIEQRPDGGRMDVRVRVDDHLITVDVINDLPGTPTLASGHAVGLASARERVHAMTGQQGRIDTEVRDGRFYARLQLPR